jgi:hypothetical protein
VVIDAGIGAPSHASEALELGADAVLVNTAIAVAQDPVQMARAFKLAVKPVIWRGAVAWRHRGAGGGQQPADRVSLSRSRRMKSFISHWKTLVLGRYPHAHQRQKAADVERALNAAKMNREDLMALLPPLLPPILSRWRRRPSA